MPPAVRSFVTDAKASPGRALVFIALLLVIIGWLSSRVEWWGPPPPLRIDNWATVVVGSEVRYSVSGEKLTDAVLISNTAAWVFSDGASMPATITRADDSDVPVVQAIRRQGERFTSAVFDVRIPQAASNDRGVRLRVCWGYDGGGVICVERALSEIPAA